MIIGFYLLTFKKDKILLENEIRVLDASFLKYVKKVFPIEQEILSKDEIDAENRINEIEETVKSTFKDLIESADNFKVLSPKMIREKFGSDITSFPNDLYNSNLSEEKMFEYLISKSKVPFTSLYIYYRFFSQFQHFTHAGKELFYLSKLDFIYYFFYTLILCYDFAIIVTSKILDLEVEEMGSHQEELKAVFKKYKK
jgi:hypothetical protein